MVGAPDCRGFEAGTSITVLSRTLADCVRMFNIQISKIKCCADPVHFDADPDPTFYAEANPAKRRGSNSFRNTTKSIHCPLTLPFVFHLQYVCLLVGLLILCFSFSLLFCLPAGLTFLCLSSTCIFLQYVCLLQ